MKYEKLNCWAFAWSSGLPYITTIVSYRRKDLIREVEKFMGVPWRTTYRRGGRAVKASISQRT